jgi:hypothetical protein
LAGGAAETHVSPGAWPGLERSLPAEAALRNRNSSYAIDGEAVLLGVDGRSDLTACTRADMMTRSSSTPSTSWSATARISKADAIDAQDNPAFSHAAST